MIRISAKRIIITTISSFFALLFMISLIVASVLNSRMRDGVNWGYYAFSILVVLVSLAYICIIVHSFNYNDTESCLVLCYITLILYCIADIGVRNLFTIVTRFDALSIFLRVRDFLTFMVMAFMLLDQYGTVFHTKNGYKPSIVVVSVFAFVLVLMLPTADELNIHYFFLVLTLLLGSSFHSIAYNLNAPNVKIKLRIWNAFCGLLSEIGIFMFIISLNTIVSAFGALLLFFAFISFCLESLKKGQD